MDERMTPSGVGRVPGRGVSPLRTTGVHPLRCTLLGVGAMSSPRFAPAGLLIEHGRTRVMIDGGREAEPRGSLDAWLVTDESAELIAEIRRLAKGRVEPPSARGFTEHGLRIDAHPVVHTNHPTFGYRIGVGQGSVVWAPELLEVPRWVAGADVMFAEAASFRRTIWFAGKVGGHLPAVEVAREARALGVRRLVFAHIGRETIRAMDAGERAPFGEFAADGDVYVLGRTGIVRRFRLRTP